MGLLCMVAPALTQAGAVRESPHRHLRRALERIPGGLGGYVFLALNSFPAAAY
jgi:hypothetical protein